VLALTLHRLRGAGALGLLAFAGLACGARSELDDGPLSAHRDATVLVDAPAEATPETDVLPEVGPSDAPLPDALVTPMSQCAIGPSGVSSPVAAVNAGGVVSFLDGRGNVTTPFTFSPVKSGSDRIYAEITSRGAYIAALVVDIPTTNEGTSNVAIALLDVTGRVLWSDAYTMPYEDCGGGASLVGNASGLFVASVASCTSYNLGVTFTPTSARSWTDGYVAAGDPDEQGALVVVKDGSSTENYWWYSAKEQRFFPTIVVEELASQPAFYGPWLVYATVPPFDGGLPRTGTMWLETSAGRTAIASGGDAWGTGYVTGLSIANDGPSGVACWGTSATVAQTFDVLGGGQASAPLTLVPPQGTSIWPPGSGAAFDACPLVDSEGEPFQLFALPSLGAQLFRMKAQGWQELGAPMGHLFGASALESGGTFLIGATTIGGPPLLDPDAGTGVIAGDHVQVVRPSSGASVTVPLADWTNQTYPAYFMTKDGGCVAYFESGALTLVDARAGVAHTTSLTADTSNEDLALAWTNVPGDGQVYFGLGD
jgi:hypothetical protein